MRTTTTFFIIAFGLGLSSCATGPHEIDVMCTPDRAHYVGIAGWRYEDACREERAELRESYERGRGRARAESALAAAERDRAEAQKRSDEDQSVLNHIVRFANVTSTGSYTPSEDSRVAKHREDVAKQMEGVSLSPGFTTPAMDVGLGLFAPMIGMTLGFGAGQGVQGRWSDVGWKFTLADVSLLGGSIVAAHNCDDGSTACGVSGAMMLGFFVSRLWQTVDLFSEWNRRMKFRMAPSVVTSAPSSGASAVAPGAMLAWEF